MFRRVSREIHIALADLSFTALISKEICSDQMRTNNNNNNAFISYRSTPRDMYSMQLNISVILKKCDHRCPLHICYVYMQNKTKSFHYGSSECKTHSYLTT